MFWLAEHARLARAYDNLGARDIAFTASRFDDQSVFARFCWNRDGDFDDPGIIQWHLNTTVCDDISSIWKTLIKLSHDGKKVVPRPLDDRALDGDQFTRIELLSDLRFFEGFQIRRSRLERHFNRRRVETLIPVVIYLFGLGPQHFDHTATEYKRKHKQGKYQDCEIFRF